MAARVPVLERVRRLRGTRTLYPAFIVSVVILGIVVLMAVFADWVMLHDPYEAVLSNRLRPPFWQDGGNLIHPLGTDSLGRGILSRIILGARVSVIVATSAIFLGGCIGTALGLLAGYYGKGVDSVIMRASDVMLAFPTIFLALLLAVVLGPSLGNLIVVLTLVLWARFARVVRGEVLSWKTRDFVALAKIAGASSLRIMLRHIFPNVLNTVVVMATLQVGFVILLEAALSFLGAGVPPPIPTWGSMVAAHRDYLATAWWASVFPGLAILLTVLALNLLGDWLRDALDPKLRQI
jgi:peptide/nickel transport system permease protein